MRLSHCIVAAVIGVLFPGGLSAQQPLAIPSPEGATSTFTIFIRGVPVGAEQIGLARTADGWTISSGGRIGPPVDIVTRRLQVRYTPDWKPLELTLDGAVRGQPQSLHTTITGTSAASQATIGGRSSEKTDTVDETAILLPNPFFGPYEALAARLQTAAAGAMIPVYQPPIGSLSIRVGDSFEEQIQTSAALVRARRTHLTLLPPGVPPIEADLWADDHGRLLRLSVPAQALEVVREDIASVAARRLTVSRPNDEAVKAQANGFSLVGTVSKPFDVPATPAAAVILVAGSGASDRDEVQYGVPIFGQLASALADAGFLVLRYDKRGTGQSGGRAEAATLADYAEDVRAAVKFMSARKDVDSRRVAVVGYGDGGPVAMLAATADRRIAALVVLAAMGQTGAAQNMDQVRHQLERSSRTDAEKKTTLDLQERIQAAVLTGKGWDAIPDVLRNQADTAWFQSLLAFDPAKVMPGVRQPLLIVHGLLDAEVQAANADRLADLARARKNAPPVEVAKIPGVNHLLVPATTGEVDEYASLEEKRVSASVTGAISAWLAKTLAPPAR